MAKTRSSRPCDPEPRVGQAAMTPRLRRFSRKAVPMLSHCCKMCEAQFPNEQDTCFRDSFCLQHLLYLFRERILRKVLFESVATATISVAVVVVVGTTVADSWSGCCVLLVTFLRWLTGHLFTHPIFLSNLPMRPLFVVGACTSCQDGIVTRVVHRTPYT